VPGPLPARLALAARLVRAEGLRSIFERWRERQSEITRRRRYEAATLEEASALLGAGETLNVLPFPFRSGLGGVPIALAARLARERELRPVALLSHEAPGWRLEIAHRGRFLAVELDGERWRSLTQRPTAAGVEIVRTAVEALRTRVLHLESLAGLQLAGLAGWPMSGFASPGAPRALVLSAHDFALFCRRPNLVEEPSGRFCGFSRDPHRCQRCLAVDDPGATLAETSERRQSAAALLASAAAIVHVSDFSRRSHLDLFPGLDPGRHWIIPPGILASAVERESAQSRLAPRWPPRHIAFVGQAADHKGLPDFIAACATLRAAYPEVRWSVLGGGTPASLAAAREGGLKILGYFRPATLPGRLAEHRIDLAVVPSRFPETHSLVIDSCVHAGVPVLAAGVGALGERLRELRAGWDFPSAQGAAGLAGELDRILRGAAPLPSADSAALPTAANAAQAHCALYAQLASR
jgi:glycosyltransferase involved in cell wall biosynthesis